LTSNELLVAELHNLLPESRIDLIAESHCLEAFGAAVAAMEAEKMKLGAPETWLKQKSAGSFSTRPSLRQFQHKVKHMVRKGFASPKKEMKLILGVDSGSTTTKSILFDRQGQVP
jgi:activator of 2-hydroxyglutaryl-CoA dehydratase